MGSLDTITTVGVPRTYGQRYVITATDFVSKYNPEMFGALNMHQNKIINLADGTNPSDAINLQQLSGSTSSVTLGSMLVASNQVTGTPIPYNSPYRYSGAVVKPDGTPVYGSDLLFEEDVVSVFPGVATQSGMPQTNWQSVSTVTATVSGFFLGANNILSRSNGIPTNLTLKFEILVGVSANVIGYLCVFDTRTMSIVAKSTRLTIAAGPPSLLQLSLPITINSITDFDSYAVSFKMFVDIDLDFTINAVQVTEAYFTMIA